MVPPVHIYSMDQTRWFIKGSCDTSSGGSVEVLEVPCPEEVVRGVLTVEGFRQVTDLLVDDCHQDFVPVGLMCSELVNQVRDATTGEFLKSFVFHGG